MKKILLVGVLALVVAVLPVGLGDAGAQSGRLIEVTKAVEGGAPDGPYSIQVACELTEDVVFELSDGETETAFLDTSAGETCTVTEIDPPPDVSVAYSCETVDIGDDAAVCDGDDTVSWEGDLTGGAAITVTNTEVVPTTTTTTTEAPTTTTTEATTTTTQAPAAQAVQQQPAFTG